MDANIVNSAYLFNFVFVTFMSMTLAPFFFLQLKGKIVIK